MIEELWIINGNSGITLVNQRVSEVIDGDLFGGFISAIQSMLQGMGEASCDHIEMGSVQFLIISNDKGSTFFVCRSPIIANREHLQNYLLEIKDAFFKKYGKELVNWNGNLTLFDDVDEIINIKEDSRNIL